MLLLHFFGPKGTLTGIELWTVTIVDADSKEQNHTGKPRVPLALQRKARQQEKRAKQIQSYVTKRATPRKPTKHSSARQMSGRVSNTANSLASQTRRILCNMLAILFLETAFMHD